MAAMRTTDPQSPASVDLADETPLLDVSCLICGSGRADIVASAVDIEAEQRFLQKFHHNRKRHHRSEELADRAEFTQDYSTRIVQCPSCGFVFRSPRPPASAVMGAYVTDRYSDAHLQSEFLSQRQWAEKKAGIVARWVRFSNAPVVVEVGSFVGGFLYAGRRRGWSMLGVDPGKEVTEFCRAQGLPVYRGTLAEAPIPAGSVDAVVIWNTFDQLPNPDTTLAAARKVLRKEGVLIIRVPNGLMYQRGARLLDRRGLLRKWMITTLAWNNLLGFPYLHGYSVSTADQLLGRHGFRRLMVYRDTLVRLSSSDTKVWARAEEQLIKWCCRCIGAAEARWSTNRASLSPWLDLYYGLGEVIPSTPVSVARDPWVRRCVSTLAG
jgi:SAM-dependent methyltransferase